MFGKKKEKPLYDKDKVVRIVKNLIIHRNSVLIDKYLESYDKLVIRYKGDQVELHKDTKSITYLNINVSLSKKEYNELNHSFLYEVIKRKEAKTLEKLDKLEHSLNLDNKQELPLSDKTELPAA
jgi:hypothetical protein